MMIQVGSPVRGTRRSVSRRRARGVGRRGMTMVEMLFVMALIGIIMTIVTPRLNGLIDEARDASAVGDISAIRDDIMGYLAQHDSLPASLSDVGRSGTRDPWNQPYVYVNFNGDPPEDARVDQFGVTLNSEFDLYSLGKDGATSPSIMTQSSQDDVVLANDGGFIGSATGY